MLYRQGDVLIQRVNKIPKGLKPLPRDEHGRLVLAEGERTGHAHVVEGDALFLAADLDEMTDRYLRIEQEALVVHDEHDTITLPPGDYQIVRQREYTPEQIRNVAD